MKAAMWLYGVLARGATVNAEHASRIAQAGVVGRSVMGVVLSRLRIDVACVYLRSERAHGLDWYAVMCSDMSTYLAINPIRELHNQGFLRCGPSRTPRPSGRAVGSASRELREVALSSLWRLGSGGPSQSPAMAERRTQGSWLPEVRTVRTPRSYGSADIRQQSGPPPCTVGDGTVRGRVHAVRARVGSMPALEGAFRMARCDCAWVAWWRRVGRGRDFA